MLCWPGLNMHVCVGGHVYICVCVTHPGLLWKGLWACALHMVLVCAHLHICPSYVFERTGLWSKGAHSRVRA